MNAFVRLVPLLILLTGILGVLPAAAQITWTETSQADFADGYLDPNLYASNRTNLEGTAGAVEWFPRFDLDGNGSPDFVSVDAGYPFQLHVWYMGPGGLIDTQQFYIGGSGGNCDFADLNVDGFTELIHSGYSSGQVTIYWNQGGRFLATDTTQMPNNNAEAVYVGDFDKDSYLDLAVGGCGTSILFYWGAPGGTHGWRVGATTSVYVGVCVAHNMEFADLDMDGYLDGVFPLNRPGPLLHLRYAGSRTWIGDSITVPMTGGGSTHHGLSVGDLDRDGDVDVVATNTADPAAWVLFNDGTGHFPTMTSLVPTSAYGGSALYDFNSDGLLDILFFLGNPGGMLTVYPNSGVAPYFSDATKYTIGAFPIDASGGTIIDVNMDGIQDIFLNSRVGSYSYLFWGPDYMTCDSFPVSGDHHGIFREPGNIRDRSSSAWYESNIFDTGYENGVCGGSAQWVAYDDVSYHGGDLPQPIGTVVVILVRGGDTPTPDSSWCELTALGNGNPLPEAVLHHRYYQYRAELWYFSPAYLPWLEQISFTFLPCAMAEIALTTFQEETDCDGQNRVSICYTLTGDTADVALALSSDDGATWDIPLRTLSGTVGNLGTGIAPGVHCIEWLMSADLPGVEGSGYLLRATAQTSINQSLDTLRAPLDSWPPRLTVQVPSELFPGETATIRWTAQDAFFSSTNPCSLTISGPDGDVTLALVGTSLEWTAPDTGTWTFQPFGADSFCNSVHCSCMRVPLRVIPQSEPDYWTVDLRFSPTDPTVGYQTLTLGMSSLGTDGFDVGVDRIYVPPGGDQQDAFFPLTDPAYPIADKLGRDIRSLEVRHAVWIARSRDRAGTLSWQKDALPPGRFTLNGIVDMRVDSLWPYAAGDSVVIVYDFPVLSHQVLPIRSGWNLLGIGGYLPNPNVTSVFPFSPAVYRWSPGEGYAPATQLSLGAGYWVLAMRDTTLTLLQGAVPEMNWRFARGWNLMAGPLVTPNLPLSDVTFDPAGSWSRAFEMRLTPGTYDATDVLTPGYGTWILFTRSADGRWVSP